MKKTPVLVLFFLLISAFVIAEEYDGDTVYIDDAQARIAITPHTITGSAYVYLNVTSKQYTGNVNMIFGYNGEWVRPRNFERYNPHQHERTYKCPTNSMRDGTQFTCQYPNGTILMQHPYDSYDAPTSTYTWQEWEYWSPVTIPPQKKAWDFDNKNTWWVVENIPMNAGEERHARIWMDVPRKRIGESEAAFSERTEGFDPKYDVAFYPSSYGTTPAGIQAAHNSGQLKYIDPFTQLDEGDFTTFLTFNNNDADDYFNLHNFSEFGVTYDDGLLDRVAVFDGGSDRLTETTFIDITDTYTVGFWMNVTNFAGLGGADRVFQYQDSSQEGLEMLLTTDAGGNNHSLQVRMEYPNTVTDMVQIDKADPFDTGIWYHVVLRYNTTSDVSIWVDGVEQNKTDGAVAIGVTNTAIIGTDESNGNAFDGYMDAWFISEGYALTDTEIQELYNAGVGAEPPFISDSTPPIVTNVSATPTNETARVNSSSNETSNMSVAYGVTVDLGNTAGNTTMGNHSTVHITGLTSNTLYYYNVTRCDASSNCNTTGPNTFTTLTTDTTPPTITGITATPTNISAVISSGSSESSNTSVAYGTTVNLGSVVVNATYNTASTVFIGSLTNTTQYYYNVTRCDATGNCNTSGPNTFTTLSNTQAAETTALEDAINGIVGAVIGFFILITIFMFILNAFRPETIPVEYFQYVFIVLLALVAVSIIMLVI